MADSTFDHSKTIYLTRSEFLSEGKRVVRNEIKQKMRAENNTYKARLDDLIAYANKYLNYRIT